MRTTGKPFVQEMGWGNPNFLPGKTAHTKQLHFLPCTFLLGPLLAADNKFGRRLWGC